MCDFFFALFELLCLKVFAARANFLHHLTKDLLTMKITKATKGSDIFDYKLRALRALRGDT